MEKAIEKLIKRKLKKASFYIALRTNRGTFREAGKYAFALFLMVNIVSAAGLHVSGSLSRNSAERALTSFNEKLESGRKSELPEFSQNIAFLRIAEIELPEMEAPVKKNLRTRGDHVEKNASESSLRAAFTRLKKIVSDSFDKSFAGSGNKAKVALAASELADVEREIIKSISVPDVAFLKIAQIELPSIEAALQKSLDVSRTDVSAAATVALSLQSAIESVKKVLTQTIDRIPQTLTQEEDAKPKEEMDSRLFENDAVTSSQSVRAAQSNLAPSLAPVASSLRMEVARYVELEVAARESALLATISASMKRQADADANRRSVIVNNITQSADFTSPDITGGTITGASANLSTLSGAGLTNCESNNVLTWANGLFGCETDDGGGGGADPNSKFATSTNGVAIYPNAAAAVVIGASATTTTGAELEVQGDLFISGSTTLQNYVFVRGTGTAATTTNFFATTASSTSLFATTLNAGNSTLGAITSGTINSQTISSAASFTGTLNVTSGLTTLSNLLLTGSTTLQNFSFVRATGTAATTTNFFSTTSSSTNLFATALVAGNSTLGAITSGTINSQTISSAASFTGTLNVTAGLTTLSNLRVTASSTIGGGTTSSGLTIAGQATTTNLLVTSSTTLQAFSFTNGTGTNATTTAFFSTTANSTNLFGTSFINTNATITNATTTNIFATTASSTNIFGNNLNIGGAVTFSNIAATTSPGSSVCFGNATGARGLITQTNGTTACGSVSSQRFKFDINSLGEESGLAEVMALRPVSYKYKAEYLGGYANNPNWNGTFVGFIAEEIAEVDERLIEREENGQVRAVQYDKITAILAKATQEITTTLGINPSSDAEDYESVALSTYFNKLWRAIGDRLANASSALDRIFAKRFQATELICINETCINEEQLQAILSQYSASGGSAPIPPPAPQPEAEPEPDNPPETPMPSAEAPESIDEVEEIDVAPDSVVPEETVQEVAVE